MALTEVNITPLLLPLSTAKRLISRTCHSTWDNTFNNALCATSMGQYRKSSSPQPWIRQTCQVLDAALARLRLERTQLSAHLYRLRMSPDPYCPWCRNVEKTIEHFMLQCLRSYSHRIFLRSQLLTLNITTFDLLTLLGAVGVQSVHPSRQSAVICFTCAFLRRPVSYQACDHLAGRIGSNRPSQP